jgi:hypothetical protein
VTQTWAEDKSVRRCGKAKVDPLARARDVADGCRPRCGRISPFQGGDRLMVLLVREPYVPMAADVKEESKRVGFD